MSPTQQPKEDPPFYRCGNHWHVTSARTESGHTPWYLCNASIEDEPFRGRVLITSGYKNDPEPYTIDDWFASMYFTLKRDGEVLMCYVVDRRGEEQFFTERDVRLVESVQVYADIKEAVEKMKNERNLW